MIDRIWCVKFTAIMNVPGNQIVAYFATEEAARRVMDGHAKLITNKLYEETEALVFDDILGLHCMRADLFPYCFMSEIAQTEKSWKEISDKIRAIQQETGTGDKNVGFKSQPETK